MAGFTDVPPQAGAAARANSRWHIEAASESDRTILISVRRAAKPEAVVAQARCIEFPAGWRLGKWSGIDLPEHVRAEAQRLMKQAA